MNLRAIDFVFGLFFANRLFILGNGLALLVALVRERESAYMDMQWPRSVRFVWTTCLGRGNQEIFSAAAPLQSVLCRRLARIVKAQYGIEVLLVALIVFTLIFNSASDT